MIPFANLGAASGTPVWFALLLPSEQAAIFTPLEELLNPDAAIIEQLIYLVEQPSGAMGLVAPSRFHKIVRQQSTTNAQNRQDETAISH